MKRTYDYQIDFDGQLIFAGSPILDEKTQHFFLSNLKQIDGEYRVLCMGEINYISCADVPYVIQHLHITAQGSSIKAMELVFIGNYTCPFDPRGLTINSSNQLYCQIRGGEFTARFSRKCYIELSAYIQEKHQKYGITDQDQFYPIQPSWGSDLL